ncbi:MAG: inorganic diphosphatase [Corallococcus sp.]|nr:inorganic diphosphatase [Corallococcus sp.]
MNIWHEIDKNRISSTDFIAVVEISKGGKEKYELDKATGRLILDRILYTSTHYPANYGFIPLTLAGDGDPMDVLILCSQPLIPLSMVRCYPIGVITMADGGDMDEKIIAIPYTDPNYNCYKSIKQLPKHVFDEMQHFFSVYKQLENKTTAVSEVHAEDKAIEIVQKSIDNYFKKYPDGGKRRMI